MMYFPSHWLNLINDGAIVLTTYWTILRNSVSDDPQTHDWRLEFHLFLGLQIRWMS